MKTPSLPFVFFEGKIVAFEDAKVSIMTNALQYGTGAFGGMRGYYDAKASCIHIFMLDDHIKRFLSSFKILGVKLEYTAADIKKIVLDLVRKNKPKTDVYFRFFGYAGSLNLSPDLHRDHTFSLAVYVIPLGDYLPTDRGISVGVSAWRRIADNAIPSRAKISGGYVNSALAKRDAHIAGYDEAIFLNEHGHVAEGSAMNIFLVRSGVLITPSESDDVLEGITRRSVIDIAKNLKIPVVERSIDRSELYIADEVFFTGTAAQISWIAKIDNRQIGNGELGPIAKKLQKTFFDVVRGKDQKYKSWLTQVKV